MTSGSTSSTGLARSTKPACLGFAIAVLSMLGWMSPGVSAPPDAKMMTLTGGTFTMGNAKGLADEMPTATVTLKDFLMDRRPVTNAEFADFLERVGGSKDERGVQLFDWDDNDARIHTYQGRWRADQGYENHPVVEASWPGALAYCQSRGRRLPTEAEFEYAARGTQGRPYAWGPQPPDATRARYGIGFGKTVASGSLQLGGTPDGLLDMTGNVSQWTSSLYLPYPYRIDDGREDLTKPGTRTTRGAAADTGPETLSATWRGATISRAPSRGHHNIGFRCAKDKD